MVYFFNEEGREISKRNRENDREADYKNARLSQPNDIVSKKLTPPGSLVEAHELFLEFEFVMGERRQIVNPLGTEFDVAEIFIGESKERLKCSPFLCFWSNEELEEFSGRKGLWLTSNPEKIILEFSNSDESVAFDPSCTLFFPVLDVFQDAKLLIRLVVTCTN